MFWCGSSYCPFRCSLGAEFAKQVMGMSVCSSASCKERLQLFFLSCMAPEAQLWFQFHLCWWATHQGLFLRLPQSTPEEGTEVAAARIEGAVCQDRACGVAGGCGYESTRSSTLLSDQGGRDRLVGREAGKKKGREFLCYTASKPKPNTQVKCLIPKGHPGKQGQA